MLTYVDAINKGVTVKKKTVGVGRQIIIKMNTHFIKHDSTDGFENRAVLTALRQDEGRGSEVGSYIWNSCSWHHDTDMREIEQSEKKLDLST